MVNGPDTILIVLLLTNFFILGTASIRAAIRAIAVQGFVLSLLPVWEEKSLTIRLALLVIATLSIKGFAIPRLLDKAMRDVHIRHEMEPYLGFVSSLFLCALGTGLALLFADQLPLASADSGSLYVPAAAATVFAGFLVLTTRRKAISQVIGYLMLENGVYVFGLLLYQAMLIEVGVLLDLLVGIFVMGIVLNHIRREFSSLDTEMLSSLRE